MSVSSQYDDEVSVGKRSDFEAELGDVDRSTSLTQATASSDKKETFVKRESRQVLYLRLIVIGILLAAGAGIASVVSYVSTQAERDEMKTQYEGSASKVVETFLNIAQVNMEAAGSLVVAIVDYGLNESNEGWPFVTVGSFQRRAATVKDLSGALYIGLNPVIYPEQREAWEEYSTNSADANWYAESVEYQETLEIMHLDNRPQVQTDDPTLNLTGGVANKIYNLKRAVGAKAVISPPNETFHLPIWQTSPITTRSMVNQNRASNSEGILKCLEEDAAVFEGMQFSRSGFGDDSDPYTAEIAWLLRLANKRRTKYEGDIFTTVYLPLYDSFHKDRKTVGVMRLIIHWARYFRNLLPEGVNGITMVLDNNCDEPYTYEVNGPDVIPIGHGDRHELEFDDTIKTASFAEVTSIPDGTTYGLRLLQDECPYTIRVYQSKKFLGQYYSSRPVWTTTAVAAVFVFTIGMFFVYDRLVERRQRLISRKAEQTSAIVSSLFPTNVRDRLLETSDDGVSGAAKKGGIAGMRKDQGYGYHSFFADIAGFTAWSSSRGPEQVFTLLQTIYQTFDEIANRLGVFKVETIGDSYMAVTGCPHPQEHHAIIMSRFAAECLRRLQETLTNLELSLGPGTADLSMRFGIHSGPVTAGVLRGDRSRFQLFGDTVNTAARMESTGVRGMIQASQSTADLLIASGKAHWVRNRPDAVLAKGKGTLATYWVNPRSKNNMSSTTSSATGSMKTEEIEVVTCDQKRSRNIDWMTNLLLEYVKKIRAAQQFSKPPKDKSLDVHNLASSGTALDEVVPIIQLKRFDDKQVTAMAQYHNIEIDDGITASMRELVSDIAANYHDTPFHNFEHSCHVTMNVDKFMKRIVAPSIDEEQIRLWKERNSGTKEIASHLYDYTHGINADPIALFAIVFSGLVHDVDHRGVGNEQLKVEAKEMADYFKHKSIAEQNSVEIAWNIFSSDKFSGLRDYIFGSQDDLRRFRQVVVTVILATDIFDKELSALRRSRWDKAFGEDVISGKCDVNGLRATIVVEHIIQASDVAHTMQHWHIYQKWNKRLFHEMLQAYRQGRLGADPATFWYQGELKFFDNYIIPLAKKLKDCNVFGVSSYEVLNYAVLNRAEWEAKGQQIVAEFVAEHDANNE